MAFYYDHNVGNVVFSEHEFHGGGLQYPSIMRPITNLMAEQYQVANALPNLYGDLYERFKEENAMRAMQGLPPIKDSLFERDEMKEVRAARDRGDRSDKSIWPGHAFDDDMGGAVDWYGQPRSGQMCLTQVSDPVPLWPGRRPSMPGDQPCLNGMPILYPW
jgi:hypothetical protein